MVINNEISFLSRGTIVVYAMLFKDMDKEVFHMTETVMETNALQEVLLKLIPTEKVRVKEVGGVIQLLPVKEDAKSPLRGLASDSKLTVDRFLAITHDEKEMTR